ncbi:MAG: phosphopyruvate hydratase [Nanoarchaeota archaeon]|nr:phosphopyruvate hydratase [Nanoarchaeota archaeon]
MKIKKVLAREILDSRGNPTLEVDLHTKRFITRAMVPSGASTGIHEALELRDKQKRYLGKGVQQAVRNIAQINKKIKGMDCRKQTKIDQAMIKLDNTENKRKLGANAILGVSMAVCRAGAMSKGLALYEYIAGLYGNKKPVLPKPFFNIINGGKHAGNQLAIQEFMISPKLNKFQDNLRAGSEIYHTLKKILEKNYGKSAINVGDEGGFAPNLKKTEDALNLIKTAITKAGYHNKVNLAMDCAASEFYHQGKYKIDGKSLDKKQLLNHYLSLIKKHRIYSIEDPFDQEDFIGFGWLREKSNIQVVGDDLTVTNIHRIARAIKLGSCNCLLLKVNQIGTITEALAAAHLAMSKKWKVMVSHRSGETEDPFIADLAVGIGASQIKSGAPCRSERLSKYNQLLRIEEEIKK